MDAAELVALDRAHVWHPYGPMPGTVEPLVVASANGVRLRLAEAFAAEFGFARTSLFHTHPALSREPATDAVVTHRR